jgi:murein DD-endopeptidase MepM/ murein hydrolase activator NlpD
MFMLPGNNRFLTSAITLALAAGLSIGAVSAAGAAADVSKQSEAAKQAAKALDKAKAEADKSSATFMEATKNRKTAAKAHSAADEEFEAARLRLDRAQAALTSLTTDLEAARAEVEAFHRDEGLIDVAAQVTAVASGKSDNPVLDTVAGAVKAGLNGILGPVVSLLDPIGDAVNGHVDEADRAWADAAARERHLVLAWTGAVSVHHAASDALARAQQETASAHAVLVKAEKSEAKAAKQVKKDAKAAKQAKAKATKAKKAAKEAEQQAAKNAGQDVAAARASAATASRSAGGAGKVRPATGAVTSHYGQRTHPITGVRKLHSGTDYAYGDGNAYAASSGQVASVVYDGAYGNLVTVSHGGGVETRYAHLARASVSVGQQVSGGQVIGRIGATGMATGAHLHFEVLVNGEFVNPQGWLGGWRPAAAPSP